MPRLLSHAQIRLLAPSMMPAFERARSRRFAEVDALETPPYSLPNLPPMTVHESNVQRLRLLSIGIDVYALRSGIPQTTIAVREEDVVVI